MSDGDDRPKEDGAGAKNTNHRQESAVTRSLNLENRMTQKICLQLINQRNRAYYPFLYPSKSSLNKVYDTRVFNIILAGAVQSSNLSFAIK
jgi:hypothetical protein